MREEGTGTTGMGTPVWALGLMSGTSLDGIDAALIRTDGERVTELGPWSTTPYEESLHKRLSGALGGGDADVALSRAVTMAHGEAVEALLDGAGIRRAEVHVIGFHGHTLLHRPARKLTVQIGDGACLAGCTGIDVVNDFRAADVAAGGEGAPFAPLYHAARAGSLGRPLAVLNIGGVANVTWIGEDDDLIAFDTGPGNGLIDHWAARHLGEPMDRNGRLAASGQVSEARLDAVLSRSYFLKSPPKSLDISDFTTACVDGLSPADGAANLTALTAATVAAAVVHLPAAPQRWLVTGGGRRNPVLMAMLADRLGVRVDAVEVAGWRGDALEAEAFAFLAVRSLRGLPLSLPGTTGVPAPCRGGRVHSAHPVD